MHPVVAFDAPFRLRRTRCDDANSQSLSLRWPTLIDILPIGVQRPRTPYFAIHDRSTPTAAQMVSCSPRRQHAVPVASSTIFIRPPRGPRSSNHAWKLPSSCTKSPKCCRRSRRLRCAFRLRMRLPSPSANMQRRSVSSATSSPSSSAKCSAASVGPNRSCSVPEYFSRRAWAQCARWQTAECLRRLAALASISGLLC